MKILISIGLALIICSTNVSFSQETISNLHSKTNNFITLASGLSFHSVRDEMMSPLIYSRTQIPIELSYLYSGLSNRHTVTLFYSEGDLHSSITKNSAHYIKNLNLCFEYTFATEAWKFEVLNTTFFPGARFSSMLNLRDHFYLSDKSHMSAEQMTNLGFYLLSETSFGNESANYLSIEVNIPFISYALLTNRYNANVSEKFDDLDFEQNVMWQVFKKGELVTFNKFFEIQADIAYKYFLSSSIGFDLRYRFRYYTFEQFKSLFRANVLNTQFLVGFKVIL